MRGEPLFNTPANAAAFTLGASTLSEGVANQRPRNTSDCACTRPDSVGSQVVFNAPRQPKVPAVPPVI